MDLSTGDYRFSITDQDGLLQWNGLTYWKLSMDPMAYTNSNSATAYMALNGTGIYLFGGNGPVVVIQVVVSQSAFRIAKLDSVGRFSIKRFSSNAWKEELAGPDDDCRIPLFCSRIGLCTDANGSGIGVCSRPSGFHAANKQRNRICLPIDTSSSLSSPLVVVLPVMEAILDYQIRPWFHI